MHSLLLFYRVIIEDLCVESGVNCRAMLVISSWEELLLVLLLRIKILLLGVIITSIKLMESE